MTIKLLCPLKPSYLATFPQVAATCKWGSTRIAGSIRQGVLVYRMFTLIPIPLKRVFTPNLFIQIGISCELIMLDAHKQDHKGARITLWRSQAKAWIWKGAYLATKLSRNYLICHAKAAILSTQRMGNLPEERINPDSKPFIAICLDLLGPALVKAMTNKRAQMKVSPIFFVCQATGALHTQVTHDYGKKAFSLQYDHYTMFPSEMPPRRL